MSSEFTSPDTGIIVKPEQKTKRPRLFKVVLLNDDYTPMDFVVFVLKKFFSKNENEATEIMMQVHNKGAGIAGIFPFSIAETKALQVNDFSKRNEHPLKCTVEPEGGSDV